MRDAISYLVNSYIYTLGKKGVKQEDIRIPESLAQPLFNISNNFKMKYGLSSAFSYNWHIHNEDADLDDLRIDDIRLNWYFTDNK